MAIVGRAVERSCYSDRLRVDGHGTVDCISTGYYGRIGDRSGYSVWLIMVGLRSVLFIATGYVWTC